MCVCVYVCVRVRACVDTGIDGSVQKCIFTHIHIRIFDLYSVLREIFECPLIVTEMY